MRPFGSPTTLERRRRRALALLQQGLSVRDVARRVQASGSSVSQWREAWPHGGDTALRHNSRVCDFVSHEAQEIKPGLAALQGGTDATFGFVQC
jgi:transposase